MLQFLLLMLHFLELRDAPLAPQALSDVLPGLPHLRRRQFFVDELCKSVFQMRHINHLPMMFATG